MIQQPIDAIPPISGSLISASEYQDSNTHYDRNDHEHAEPTKSVHSPTHSFKTAHRLSPSKLRLLTSCDTIGAIICMFIIMPTPVIMLLGGVCHLHHGIVCCLHTGLGAVCARHRTGRSHRPCCRHSPDEPRGPTRRMPLCNAVGLNRPTIRSTWTQLSQIDPIPSWDI